MSKPTIYLAGPISGCNDDQLHVWRNELKRGFGDEFDFIDPTGHIIGGRGSEYEVVQADIDAIKSADAVLANMWRESIGTAMGVVHAHSVGKIVVVCDPNHLGSKILGFYADAVERSLPGALASIRTFVGAQKLVLGVQKNDGTEQPFDRQKLGVSIRKACIAAKQSDVVPARAICARALSLLLSQDMQERLLTTKEIKEAVWEALAELGSDPMHEADYDAIRTAWERHDQSKGAPVPKAAPARKHSVVVHASPLDIRVGSRGTHSTIWGKHGTIGADALVIFQQMARFEGITEIVLGPFRNTGSPPIRPHVRLQASKTLGVIEGKCFDNGKKGTLQTFQVRVADQHARDAILVALRELLTALGHIRPTSVGDAA